MSRIKKKIVNALGNRQLRKAVLNATDHSLNARSKVIADFDDFEKVRDEAREVRQRSLDKYGEYLEKFKSSFSSAGGIYHFAETGSQARELVLEILREANARQGVKSKSMVSEEIELGHAFEKAGIDAVESDLGEFIVQLGNEPPSHITAPALHRSREEIGKLFHEKLDMPYSDDPQTLTTAARDILRQRFLNAEFGISGGNFLIADTGHILIVENEGNARLGLSLPKLYIAITGLEKLIESTNDAAPILKLLARSATGQRAPGYVHLLKPTQPNEDGPKELHLIVLDNGRSDALNDPELREMLLCIRCGACLNVCPVYRTVGGHTYDSTYPGPMGAVISNLIGEEPKKHAELPQLSTLCGACRDICPVRIDIPRMLLELRKRTSKSLVERFAAKGWEFSMSTQKRYETAGVFARAAAGILPEYISGGVLKNGVKSFRDGGGKNK